MGGDVANALRASSGGSDKEHVLAPIPLVELGCRTGHEGRGNANPSGLGLGEADQDPPVMTDIAPAMIVRRLMPVECERLQGFPERWTLVPVGGRMAADGPRYKQLGNSWAVSCIRWYGARITAHLASVDSATVDAADG